MYEADSGDITPFHVVMTKEKNHFMAAVDTNDQELINKAMDAYEDKTWELQRVAFDDKSEECGVFRVFNVPALGDCLFHAVWLHLYIHSTRFVRRLRVHPFRSKRLTLHASHKIVRLCGKR